MPFNIGAPELIIILVIALLIIGPGKLPDVGSALGKSIREFRKASSDIQESVKVDTTPIPPQAASAQPAPVVASAAAAAPAAQAAVAQAAAPVATAEAQVAPAAPVPTVAPAVEQVAPAAEVPATRVEETVDVAK